MWILATIASMVILSIVQIPMRTAGLTLTTYLIYAAGVLGGTAWLIPYSVNNAPSFVLYWFTAIGLLSVIGCLVSIFFFGETFQWRHGLGVCMVIAGAYLLK